MHGRVLAVTHQPCDAHAPLSVTEATGIVNGTQFAPPVLSFLIIAFDSAAGSDRLHMG